MKAQNFKLNCHFNFSLQHCIWHPMTVTACILNYCLNFTSKLEVLIFYFSYFDSSVYSAWFLLVPPWAQLFFCLRVQLWSPLGIHSQDCSPACKSPHYRTLNISSSRGQRHISSEKYIPWQCIFIVF